MGSYDSAVMTGFICRLCSELNRNVVHIYSEKGRKLELAKKINLMPICVEPQDSLPKTICQSCITQLDSQYRLIQQLERSREKIMEHQARIRNNERERQALIRERERQAVILGRERQTLNCETSNHNSESCDEEAPHNNSSSD